MVRLLRRPLSPQSNPLPERDIRVVSIDDHPVIHEALEHTLGAAAGLAWCGGAFGLTDAVKLLESTGPDVAIVDLSLGEVHGIDVVADLHTRFPGLKILVYSVYEELMYAERALRAGASGYVTKTEPVSTLLEAVGTVARTGLYLSPRLISHVRLPEEFYEPRPRERSGPAKHGLTLVV